MLFHRSILKVDISVDTQSSLLKSVSLVSNMFFVVGMILMCLMSGGNVLFCWKVINIGSVKLDLLFLVDKMSLLFFSTLCIMVSCVLKFSTVYMSKEIYPNRFHYLVYSFVFSMFCMMFFPHFFFLLMGWDGLGITSFLLVVYYMSSSSWSAGLKTYLLNRIGDGLFLMALGLLMTQGHWDITGVFKKEMFWLFIMVLFFGCFTKSAQFPFSSWLPAAMAAPTPVSALVHSSTLVTAGMYLMMRFHYMIPAWMFLMMGMCGLWTLFSASLAACVEWDGKKMVAFSTLSQLGFMAVGMSLNLNNFAFFHLMTHALFKAMMFICVGFLMIKKNHYQDLRSLSGMWSCSPMISMSLVISSMSLMGVPFFSGFFSKESMLEKNLFGFKEMFHNLLLLSLPFTSYYVCRLMLQLFLGKGYSSLSRMKDKNVMVMSLLPLYLGSMGAGASMGMDLLSMHWLYPCSLSKMFMILLIGSGMILALYGAQMKNSTFSWFFSEINYMSPFKGSYWMDKLGNVGDSYYKLFDQGQLSKVMSAVDINLLKSGSFTSKSIHYFFSPKVKYYLVSISLMLLGSLALLK